MKTLKKYIKAAKTERKELAKGTAIILADSKGYVKPSDIILGDSVLVKRPFTRSKGMSVYDPNPMKVVKTEGTMITAKNGDNTISRNSSFFKKLRLTVPEDERDTIDTPSVIEHP